MAEERYKVMTEEDVTSYKEFAKAKVKLWHDNVHPKYIFLTETSGTQFGWLFKEAWRTMYPKERPPSFYRINVNSKSIGSTTDWLYHRIKERDEEIPYFAKRIKDNSAPTIVFDEVNKGCSSKYSPDGSSLCRADSQGRVLRNSALCSAKVILQDIVNLNNLWVDAGAPSSFWQGRKSYLKDYIADQEKEMQEKTDGPIYIKPTRKDQKVSGESLNSTRRLVGYTEKDPNLRRRALDYIHDLKLAGKEAGIEERQEQQKKKKDLEKKVISVVSILGLISSLFFLGSSVTGNAIGNLSKNSVSRIGIVLLCMSLISGLFWMKKRKK